RSQPLPAPVHWRLTPTAGHLRRERGVLFSPPHYCRRPVFGGAEKSTCAGGGGGWARLRMGERGGGLEGGWWWMHRGCRIAVYVLALVLFAAVPVFAQLPTATILGSVKDPSGALVTTALVTVQNVDTGTSRSIPTDETGAYRLAALPVGHYDLKVEAP